MKKMIFSWLCVIGFSFGALAQPSDTAQLRDPVPAVYTVVKGDTLWDISSAFLENPWMWPEIWHVNTQIANPHLIYPGDIIKLVYIDGQPRLTIDRPGGRTFKLSPQARVLEAEDAISTIPLEKINSWLSRSRILQDNELERAPYVVAGENNRLLVGEGDSLYARGSFPNNTIGTGYGIFRKGEAYVDPETGEKLGMLARDIGSVEIRTPSSSSDITTMNVTRTTEEVRLADRFLEHEERLVETTFYPSPPATPVKGQIVGVERGVTQIGKLSIVMLSLGDRDNVESGNVLAIFKKGKTIVDRVTKEKVTLPDERSGLVMVFKTYEKMSLGLVLEAGFGVTVNDIVKNP